MSSSIKPEPTPHYPDLGTRLSVEQALVLARSPKQFWAIADFIRAIEGMGELIEALVSRQEFFAATPASSSPRTSPTLKTGEEADVCT